jgi:hypothetical protein
LIFSMKLSALNASVIPKILSEKAIRGKLSTFESYPR